MSSTLLILKTLNPILQSLGNKPVTGEIQRLATQYTKVDSLIAPVRSQITETNPTKLDEAAKTTDALLAAMASEKATVATSTMLRSEFSQLDNTRQQLYTSLNKMKIGAEDAREQIAKIATEIVEKIKSGEIKPEQIQGQGAALAISEKIAAAEKQSAAIQQLSKQVFTVQEKTTNDFDAFLKKCEGSATPAAKSLVKKDRPSNT